MTTQPERKLLYSLPQSFFSTTYTETEEESGKYIILHNEKDHKQAVFWKILISEPKKKELLFISNRELYLHPNDRLPEVQKLSSIEKLAQIHKITIIMGHGGYFSAAIFENARTLHHKTFHRYITRRKQGGRQSKRDASGRCRSAGAHIRRYNEEKHDEEIHELLDSWKADIETSQLIFIHLPGQNKLSTFEGTHIDKDDPRIRTIPFPVYRPKTSEVKRIYNELITITFIDDQSELEGVDLSQSQDSIPILDGSNSESGDSDHASDKDEEIFDDGEDDDGLFEPDFEDD